MMMQSRSALLLSVNFKMFSSPLRTLFTMQCISDPADAHFFPKTDLMGFPLSKCLAKGLHAALILS